MEDLNPAKTSDRGNRYLTASKQTAFSDWSLTLCQWLWQALYIVFYFPTSEIIYSRGYKPPSLVLTGILRGLCPRKCSLWRQANRLAEKFLLASPSTLSETDTPQILDYLDFRWCFINCMDAPWTRAWTSLEFSRKMDLCSMMIQAVNSFGFRWRSCAAMKGLLQLPYPFKLMLFYRAQIILMGLIAWFVLIILIW